VQKEGKDIFMSKGKTKKVHGVSSKVEKEKEKEEKRYPSVHHENAFRGRHNKDYFKEIRRRNVGLSLDWKR
jgi:hypothetical protein